MFQVFIAVKFCEFELHFYCSRFLILGCMSSVLQLIMDMPMAVLDIEEFLTWAYIPLVLVQGRLQTEPILKITPIVLTNNFG